jgi:hypothetical protein
MTERPGCLAYAWYYFSGVRTYVEMGRNAKEMMLKMTARSVTERARRRPIEALKNISKSFVAVIPGTSYLIDVMFDRLDESIDVHSEEVNAIAVGALDEINSVIGETGSSGYRDSKTALKVFDILKRTIGKLSDVSLRVGGHALEPLMDKYPVVQEKIGDSYEQMRALSERKGVEAKALLDDTTQQARATLILDKILFANFFFFFERSKLNWLKVSVQRTWIVLAA